MEALKLPFWTSPKLDGLQCPVYGTGVDLGSWRPYKIVVDEMWHLCLGHLENSMFSSRWLV